MTVVQAIELPEFFCTYFDEIASAKSINGMVLCLPPLGIEHPIQRPTESSFIPSTAIDIPLNASRGGITVSKENLGRHNNQTLKLCLPLAASCKSPFRRSNFFL